MRFCIRLGVLRGEVASGLFERLQRKMMLNEVVSERDGRGRGL
jgi:hypothetical protein